MATFIFREILSHTDLETAFRFRYDVYSQSEMNAFLLKPNDHQWDIDGYDLHSYHFGLFNEGEIVGYLRIVHKPLGFINQCVASFLTDKAITLKTPQTELPLLSYTGVPSDIKQFYAKEILTRPIVEASRIIVSPKYRNMKLAHIITESIMAPIMLMFGEQKGLVAISCDCPYEVYYKSYGFDRLANVGAYSILGRNFDRVAISLSLNLSLSLEHCDVPTNYHGLLQSMVREYSTTGQIARAA